MTAENMAAEHLPAPTAVQADDVFLAHRVPDWHGRHPFRFGLDQGTGQSLMHGRDQGDQLVAREFVMLNIRGDDFGRPLALLVYFLRVRHLRTFLFAWVGYRAFERGSV